ncbi:MAG: CDP-glycerol glycerophosphotransferase family protein [Saccharofermentans sp.]|nr:CDP-glycerol glycerophosphotransferase family protein [Saccharofermentans sp.]
MNLFKVLYIDPGTGGMLFTVLFGVFGVVVFSLRALMLKLKFTLGSDKGAKANEKKIPVAIFAEHKRYWNIFEPILDELEKKQQETVYMTCSEDDPIFKKNYKYITGQYIGEGNKAFSRLNLLNASVVFSTTPSLDVFQWKRSKNVDCYIHIMHAAKDITLYRMYGTDHYDAIILSGKLQEKQVRQMEEMRNIKPRDLALCGVPYMDVMKKRLEASGPVPAHERTVLLAPSWGESGILSRFGEKLIDDLISTGYKVIVRPHPQSFATEKAMLDKLMAKYDDPAKVTWNSDLDNFEVLRTSDILISDFSGVMFEFAMIFDKPIIYTDTNFDAKPYDADWIDETPWTFSILPSLGLKLNDDNADKIKELIDRCIEDPSFTEGRAQARSDIWVNIGKSAELSADFIIRKYREVTGKSLKKKSGKKSRSKSKKKRRAGIKK